ncbi:MAG: PIN domain-containing protein [Halopenitus sp.]
MTGDDAGGQADADVAGDAGDVAGDGDEVADEDAPIVALDASALMAPVETGLRLFEELDRLLPDHRAVVPDAVVAELERLQDGAGEAATAASVGADLASRVDTVETAEGDAAEPHADDAIVALAEAGEVDYVVTNDRPLRNRVLARGVPVIGLRGRNALGITEP